MILVNQIPASLGRAYCAGSSDLGCSAIPGIGVAHLVPGVVFLIDNVAINLSLWLVPLRAPRKIKKLLDI